MKIQFVKESELPCSMAAEDSLTQLQETVDKLSHLFYTSLGVLQQQQQPQQLQSQRDATADVNFFIDELRANYEKVNTLSFNLEAAQSEEINDIYFVELEKENAIVDARIKEKTLFLKTKSEELQKRFDDLLAQRLLASAAA